MPPENFSQVTMNPIPSASANFDVRILDNDRDELSKLLVHLKKHADTAFYNLGKVQHEDPQRRNPITEKSCKNLIASILEASKISDFVKEKIAGNNDESLTFVVAYDPENLPQAIGFLQNRIHNGTSKIEIVSIITSIWNLNYPDDNARTKGAGSAIVDFCKHLGKERKAKSLNLWARPISLPFFEKHGFKELPYKPTVNQVDEIPFIYTRLSFDLDESAAAQPS